MKRVSRAQVVVAIIALAIASCTAWALQFGGTLTMDGSVLSTDVQMMNGRAYVPLSDMARVLGRVVAKNGKAYTLTPVGGGYRIGGAPGKMAHTMASGNWLFQVASVQQVATYTPQYGSNKDQILPKEAGDVLIVLQCRLKNGTKEMQEVSFDTSSSGNTAITDGQEHGYVPLAYDSRDSGYTSDKLPVGAAHDFVIIFSVPKGADLQDLTYTVDAMGSDTSTNFRISLKP